MSRPNKRSHNVLGATYESEPQRAAPRSRNSLLLSTRMATFTNANTENDRSSSYQEAPILGAPKPSAFDFRFTSDLRSALHTSAVAAPTIESTTESSIRANQVDEDLEEEVLEAQGLGQNEMTSEWLNVFSQMYLDTIMEGEALPMDVNCYSCQSPKAEFRCRDCLHSSLHCRQCLVSAHRNHPTHRFQEWNGTFFESRTPLEIGVVVHLGHNGNECNLGSDKAFILGDLHGLHEIRVRFCRHNAALSPAKQLIAAHIFPCSTRKPRSGFTFNLLRHFRLYAGEAKLSAQRFYNVLAALTNPTNTESVPDRYREFIRVNRIWDHLMDLRHSGKATAKQSSSHEGDLAIRCPACPRLDENFISNDVTAENRFLYVIHMSYDGSFKLFRKNKSYDKWDLCLSEGRKYISSRSGYNAHLEHALKDNNLSTRDADCNNHRASLASFLKFSGLDETGIGSVICARHSFFLPGATVSYIGGERYAFTDYAIACAIYLALREGAYGLGIHYDIMCHYSKNMWDRFKVLRPPLAPLHVEDCPEVVVAVPKFHLAGHTDGCFARFSLNFLPGVGRLDGEGGERCWSNINSAASSTSEKGPGARIDGLNLVMHRWNLCKLFGMASYLADHYVEAVQMAREHKEAFRDLDQSLPQSLTQSWRKLSTVPTLVNGKWQSPFTFEETRANSMNLKLSQLLNAENASTTTSSVNNTSSAGSTAWIIEGIQLEVQQLRLSRDLKRFTSHITPKQTLMIASRRKDLKSQIDRHTSDASKWLNAEAIAHAPNQTGSRPELHTLLLPSSIPAGILSTNNGAKVMESERELRRIQCLRALQTLRALSTQWAHQRDLQKRHARGQAAISRAERLSQKLHAKLLATQSEYSHARASLVSLGMSNADKTTLLPLRSTDLSKLKSDALDRGSLGEGRIKLPWYWRVNLDSDDDLYSPEQVHKEYTESLRIQWFRARARFERWQEEVYWLQREAASVVLDFEHRSKTWADLGESTNHSGWKSYSFRQSQQWSLLSRDSRDKLLQPLKDGNNPLNKRICNRAGGTHEV